MQIKANDGSKMYSEKMKNVYLLDREATFPQHNFMVGQTVEFKNYGFQVIYGDVVGIGTEYVAVKSGEKVDRIKLENLSLVEN